MQKSLSISFDSRKPHDHSQNKINSPKMYSIARLNDLNEETLSHINIRNKKSPRFILINFHIEVRNNVARMFSLVFDISLSAFFYLKNINYFYLAKFHMKFPLTVNANIARPEVSMHTLASPKLTSAILCTEPIACFSLKVSSLIFILVCVCVIIECKIQNTEVMGITDTTHSLLLISKELMQQDT